MHKYVNYSYAFAITVIFTRIETKKNKNYVIKYDDSSKKGAGGLFFDRLDDQIKMDWGARGTRAAPLRGDIVVS